MTSPQELPIRSDFPFASRRLEAKGHRLHYIDEGAGDVVLFVHGNPTWSYMWRNVIPYFKDTARCIAVDLIGMGRSDQPDIGYTFLEHVDYIGRFIERLELRGITLVGEDWGAAIGLQYAASHPDRVKAVAMIEPQSLTPLAEWSAFSPPEARELFQSLRDPETGWPLMRDDSVFIEGMTQTIISRSIAPAEHAYYREPFADKDKRKPMWVFPNQIPIENQPSEVAQAVLSRNRWFVQTEIPKLLIYADPGCNVREPQLAWCRENLKNLELSSIGKGFHYLLEENPHGIGQRLVRWFRRNRGADVPEGV